MAGVDQAAEELVADLLEVGAADGTTVIACVVVSGPTNDLALLKPDSTSRLETPLPLATNAPRSGESVFTIGHRYPTLLGSDAKVTDGVIRATSGMNNDPGLVQR
jgi:S1-C subfamily serine protease